MPTDEQKENLKQYSKKVKKLQRMDVKRREKERLTRFVNQKFRQN